jgi:two-component system cell cycle response regulator DivK
METRGIGDPVACVAHDREGYAADEAAGKRGIVLIIEDHDATRAEYGQLLRLLGYQVEEASTGMAGVERAHTVHPDLILMDIGLPEVSGWGAARVLRADPTTSDIVLLAFSASIDSSEALRSVDEGGWFDGFVMKPIPPSELAQRIGGCIEARRLLRAATAAA